MSDQPRWLDYMRPADLLPALVNSKNHDLDLLRRSLGRWGYIEPVIIDERTKRLLGGHGRVELTGALEALGKPPADWPAEQTWPPEGVTVGDDGAWLLPVNREWRSADDAEAQAAAIALNRHAQAAGWDPAGLAAELEALARTTAALTGTGFDDADTKALLALSGTTGDREAGFLDDLAGGQRHGMGGSGALPVESALTLTLAFENREDRDSVASFLRQRATDSGVSSMAAAMLAVAKG